MIIVPVSGGKDSQACLQMAVDSGAQVQGLFCDTQFEHPATYDHICWMAEYYGVDIVHISAGSVEQMITKHRRFPGGGARFCTEELKIWMSKRYYKRTAEALGRGFEVWLGMRGSESRERSKRYRYIADATLYPPHDVMRKMPKYLHRLGVSFRLPILEWSSEEVFSYLAGKENPLYRAGFDRVGCFPCLAGGDKWKRKAFEYDEFGRQQRELVRRYEEQFGISVYRSKSRGKTADSAYSGCLICSI